MPSTQASLPIDVAAGLTEAEAAARLATQGPNEVPQFLRAPGRAHAGCASWARRASGAEPEAVGSGLTASSGDGSRSMADQSFQDPRGIVVGSTYEQLVAAYPDLACERFRRDGGAQDPGPADRVTCRTPSSRGVAYELDVLAAKKPAMLSAAQAAAGSKVSRINVEL